MRVLMNRVRKRRLALRLSQAEVARRIRRTQAFVSQLESGQIQRPSYDVVSELAVALECEASWLFPRRPARVAS